MFYSMTISVFCSCFSNVEDTGVLELQAWCHTLTSSSRQRSSRTFLGQLQIFATSVDTYVRGIGEVTTADRAALRERWESTPQNDESEAGIDPDDPWLGGALYAMKPEPPKVDAYGQLIGVTPQLAKVSLFQFLREFADFMAEIHGSGRQDY